jgi:hypothetical protein
MYAIESYMGKEQVFSAEIEMEGLPFTSFQTEDYMVFEWQNVDEQFLINETRKQYDTWVGSGYTILRFFWFIRVWFYKLLKKDIRRLNNWFPHGNQCAQLAGRLVQAVSIQYFPNLCAELNDWYLSNLAPIDLYNIIIKYPKIFKLVLTKKGDSITWN